MHPRRLSGQPFPTSLPVSGTMEITFGDRGYTGTMYAPTAKSPTLTTLIHSQALADLHRLFRATLAHLPPPSLGCPPLPSPHQAHRDRHAYFTHQSAETSEWLSAIVPCRAVQRASASAP